MFANYNQTALERMQELIEQLHKADIAYYRDDAPMMSDREYDLLMDEPKRKPVWYYPAPLPKKFLEKSWRS